MIPGQAAQDRCGRATILMPFGQASFPKINRSGALLNLVIGGRMTKKTAVVIVSKEWISSAARLLVNYGREQVYWRYTHPGCAVG